MKEEELAKTKVKTTGQIDLRLASKILEAVPYSNAFYFYTDIGRYAKRCSVCLSDFCNAIRTIDIRSVEFHSKRGDFANWIERTLGDTELASEISRVGKTIREEELRTTLLQIMEDHLTKLKKLQASEAPYLGRT